MTDRDKQKPERRYPPLYERMVPIALAVLVAVVIIMLVVIVAVALGMFPGSG